MTSLCHEMCYMFHIHFIFSYMFHTWYVFHPFISDTFHIWNIYLHGQLVLPRPGPKALSRLSLAPKSLAWPGHVRGLGGLGARPGNLRSHEPGQIGPRSPEAVRMTVRSGNQQWLMPINGLFIWKLSLSFISSTNPNWSLIIIYQ